MSDAELLAALNGEDGRKGMITMQFLQLVTLELHARNIAKASKPHWSTVPSIWLLVTSVLLSIVAILVPLIALPQVQQYVVPYMQEWRADFSIQDKKQNLEPTTKNLKTIPQAPQKKLP